MKTGAGTMTSPEAISAHITQESTPGLSASPMRSTQAAIVDSDARTPTLSMGGGPLPPSSSAISRAFVSLPPASSAGLSVSEPKGSRPPVPELQTVQMFARRLREQSPTPLDELPSTERANLEAIHRLDRELRGRRKLASLNRLARIINTEARLTKEQLAREGVADLTPSTPPQGEAKRKAQPAMSATKVYKKARNDEREGRVTVRV